MKYQRNPNDPTDVGPIHQARVLYPDGRAYCYDDQKLAYSVWLGAVGSVAFRGKNDATPVYGQDYVVAR